MQGLWVGPTVKPLLWPRSWFKMKDFPCRTLPIFKHCHGTSTVCAGLRNTECHSNTLSSYTLFVYQSFPIPFGVCRAGIQSHCVAHLPCTSTNRHNANRSVDVTKNLQGFSRDLELARICGVPNELKGCPRLGNLGRRGLDCFLLLASPEERHSELQEQV